MFKNGFVFCVALILLCIEFDSRANSKSLDVSAENTSAHCQRENVRASADYDELQLCKAYALFQIGMYDASHNTLTTLKDQQNAHAAYLQGVLHYYGYIRNAKYKLGLELLNSAVQFGSKEALYSSSFSETEWIYQNLYESPDPTVSHIWKPELERATRVSLKMLPVYREEALRNLSTLYYLSKREKIDVEIDQKHLITAVRNNDEVALRYYYHLLAKGIDRPAGPVLARRYLEKSADLGDPVSQFYLAQEILNTVGNAQSRDSKNHIAEAISWLKISSMLGVDRASLATRNFPHMWDKGVTNKANKIAMAWITRNLKNPNSRIGVSVEWCQKGQVPLEDCIRFPSFQHRRCNLKMPVAYYNTNFAQSKNYDVCRKNQPTYLRK